MYTVVGSDGQVYGPVDIDTIKQWCREGRIVAQTNLIDAISGKTIQARDVYELAEEFFSAPSGPGIAPPPVQLSAPPPAEPHPGSVRNVPVGFGERKQKAVAGVLGILLGPFGAHRFYLGYTGVGIAMLLITVLTCGIGSIVTSIWGLIEGIMCLSGSMTDSDGRELV